MSIAATMLAVLVTGCGGHSRTGPPPAVLSRTAVPDLAVSDAIVTARQLAAEVAGGTVFERRLAAWGFVQGRERTFQGESARIDRVVSRTLVFRSAGGARAYVRYLGRHVDAMYGAGSSAAALVSRGRVGYLLTAAACACHRSAPTLSGILAGGRRVTWLEANGGAVRAATVKRLVERAP